MVDPNQHYQTNEDLKKLSAWQEKWKLCFNTKDQKCKVLHGGSKNPRVEYFLDGDNLPVVDEEKDLGVFVTKDLTWVKQIQQSINKAKI